MKKLLSPILLATMAASTAVLLGGCSNPLAKVIHQGTSETGQQTAQEKGVNGQPLASADQTKPNTDANGNQDTPVNKVTADGVLAEPAAITAMVNKQIKLPASYKPADLVEPKVPFIFSEKDDRRLLRQEAAQALEAMFAAAKKDNINLAGVSGYRSYETQKTLFNYYVNTQGEASARKYSAEPGTSEHETGLAIDVTSSDGKCAAEDCFGNTPEAKWLAQHSAEYGYIIRYPKGKESITGYNYEPWHIRYVGKKIAKDIADKGITLEEFYSNQAIVKK